MCSGRWVAKWGGKGYNGGMAILIQITPQEVLDTVQAVCRIWPNIEFGPGHVVLSDYNLGDGSITFCLQECDQPIEYPNTPAAEIGVTRDVLNWLQSVPEPIRLEARGLYWGEVE